MSYPNRRSVGIAAIVTFSLIAGLLIGSLGINSLTAQAQPPGHLIGGPPFQVAPNPASRLQASIDRLEAKLDRLARVVETNNRLIATVNRGVERLEAKLDKTPGGNGDVGEAIDALEVKLDVLGEFLFRHIEHTVGALDALEAKFDRLQHQN